MRRHAGMHPGAQFREPITVGDVLASRPIAAPLKMLDCCPVSDGGAAFVVSREPHQRLSRAHHRHRSGAHPSAHQRGAEPYPVRRRLGGAGTRGGRRRAGDVRLRRHLRQLHHHADDPARGDRPGAARRCGQARARRPLQPRRRAAAQHARRAAVVRPLRCGRSDGAPGGDASCR